MTGRINENTENEISETPKNFVSFCKYIPQKKEDDEEEKPTENAMSFIKAIVPKISKTEIKKKKKYVQPNIDETFSVMSINNIVLEHLEYKYSQLGDMKKRLQRYKWIRDNSQNDYEQIMAKQAIFNLIKDMKKIKDRREILEYQTKTEKLIEKYNSIGEGVKSFVCAENIEDEKEKEKEILKNKIISIAKMYIEFDITKNKQLKNISCPDCEYTDFEPVDSNLLACKKCNTCINIIDESHTYKDIDRLNLTQKYVYTKEAHFNEAYDKFQAMQNTNIPKKLYDMIYTEMKKHNITKKNLKHEQIELFLSEGGFSKFYDDITLIYCTITGKTPPNISKYKNDLIQMNIQVEKIYSIVKDPDRINSLNVNYKLMKLLQLLGYDIRKHKFNIPKKDKLVEHDQVWKEICRHLDWKFYPTV